MRVISGNARGTKLSSVESLDTRPTLDRVKESLFNIISNKLLDAKVLDLFAGSGAIGIECLSRGSQEAYFCDSSKAAIDMVKQNLTKTKLLGKAVILNMDYRKALEKIKDNKFDLIFIDPPYKLDIAVNAIKQILQLDILSEDGIIILETDEEERDIKELEKISLNIYDVRKYGRVRLIFLNERG